MLLIKNKRPNFKELFQTYLANHQTSYDDYFYSGFYDNDVFDDDYYYDDYSLYNYYNNKKNKRGKRGKSKGKNKKISSIYNDQSFIKEDYKLIYFYEDMDNPDDNVHIFYDVYELDEYLQDHGISVKSETDTLFILNNDVIHCCVDPSSKSTGDLKLLCDNSYGSLRWEYASNDDEIMNQFS